MKMEIEFDDTNLLQSLAQGNEAAFIVIFDRYQAKVFGTAFSLLKSREMAKDIVQEVFAKIWIRRISFAHVSSLEAFIFTMTRNLIVANFKNKAEAENRRSGFDETFLED